MNSNQSSFRIQLQPEQLLDRITDAFFALDNDWNYVYLNQKAAELFGMPAAAILGKNIHEINPDVATYPLYHYLLEAKKNNKTMVAELQDPKTGKWFEDRIYPDDQGLSVYYQDITARKNHEAALDESRYHLQSANDRFEMISKAVNEALWDWDMKKNAVWGNQQYYDLVGEAGNEKSNYANFISRMHPDDFAAVQNLLEDTYRKKEELLIVEFRYKVDENKWINLLNRQIILYDTESGLPIRCLGSLIDITELKEIQKKINYEKDLSDSLINTLPGVFYMFDSDYKFLRWNQNILDITGYTNEEMKDMHPAGFVPEDQRSMIAEKIQNVFETGSDNIEADLLTKSNDCIPYLFTGIRTVYDGKTCLMGVGIDISDAVHSKNQLREFAKHLEQIREEERSHMSREIHDELGQQLTGLKMNLSWLNKKTKTNDVGIAEKMNDTIGLVENTIKTLRRIASQLRPSMLDDLGLLATMEWQSEEFEKRHQIKSIISCNRQELKMGKEIEIAIFRIYQEGLTNVAKHSGADLVQTIIHVEENLIQISINDNGRGIEKYRKKDDQSLGLLGIHERVLILGGSFEMLSEIQNGTTLLVKLPLVH
jgi:PAS domain S-box-containing protein